MKQICLQTYCLIVVALLLISCNEEPLLSSADSSTELQQQTISTTSSSPESSRNILSQTNFDEQQFLDIKCKMIGEITAYDLKLLLSKSFEEIAQTYDFDLNKEYSKGAILHQGETCSSPILEITEFLYVIPDSIIIWGERGESTVIKNINFGMSIDDAQYILPDTEIQESFWGDINPTTEYYLLHINDVLVYRLCFNIDKELYQIRVSKLI